MSNHRPCKELLNDQNIASWHTNLQEGSEITADVYLRRLNRFCEEHETTPQTLATMNAKDAFTLLVDSVSYYRAKGLTGSTIKGYIKPVKGWLFHNDVAITKTVKIKGASSTPTLKDEKTPEPYELHSVWRFCDERQAAAISIVAFTGFRPGVLGNYRGNDGLRLQDFPELRVDNEQKKVTFTAIPTRVLVREEQSKTGRAYEGFLCEEGCMRLEIYFVKRMKAGERLSPQSAVIADDLHAGRTITTKAVCKIIRKAFRHAGLQWRPYILRRYFDTRMGQAAAKAEIAERKPDNLKVPNRIEGNKVVLEPPVLMNAGDSATVKMIVSEFDRPIVIDARIAGVKEIPEIVSIESRAWRRLVLGGFLVVVGFLGAFLLLSRNYSGYYLTTLFLVVAIIGVIVYSWGGILIFLKIIERRGSRRVTAQSSK